MVIYHSGKQTADIVSWDILLVKMKTGPNIKMYFSAFDLTSTSIALMIVQFYVHDDFIKSRWGGLSHQLQHKIVPFVYAVQL